MEQIVKIRQVFPDGTAQVIHIRQSACSGDCHKCAGCGAAQESILLKAENPIGAPVGALVKVRSDSAPVLKAAAVLYLLPLALFFLGYGLGGAWAGGAGFGLSIAAIVIYDRRMAKTKTVYTITGYAQKKGDH